MVSTLINHVELAWAAGFFDGEGSTCLVKRADRPHGAGAAALRMVVVQTDPRPLARFQEAVGGLGTIGPRTPRGEHKPQWSWYASKFETIQAALAMLWPHLSQPKRDQATRCLQTWKAQRHEFGPAKKTHCVHGHVFDEANTYVHKSGRKCRTCARLNARRYAAAKGTAA